MVQRVCGHYGSQLFTLSTYVNYRDQSGWSVLISTDLIKVSIKVFGNRKKNIEPVKVTTPTFYIALLITQFPHEILVLIILSYHTLTNTAKLLNKHRLQFTRANFPGSDNGYLHRPSPSGHHWFTFTQSNVLTCVSSSLLSLHLTVTLTDHSGPHRKGYSPPNFSK